MPRSTFASRFSRLNHARILQRVAEEATVFSQSGLGPPLALFVTMETMSPFFSLYSSGTIFPLTFAPTQ